MTRHVIVVGAGIGGLSAALVMAQAGRRVTILEAASEVGGKARRVPSVAGPIDAGPTVFTMRPVFDELFASAHARLDDHVTLAQVEVLARHVWPDGSTLDLLPDMAASEARVAAFAGAKSAAEFRDFTARAAQLFAAFETPVMRHPRPTPAGVARALGRDAWRLLPAMAPLSTLARALAAQFSDPRLAQLFGRYATYVGGSPYLSPAILMLIWQAEAAGVWRIEGGIASLARAIADLARSRGAELRLDTPVTGIDVSGGRAAGVTLAGSETIAGDAIVFNGDPSALGAGLLGRAVRSAARATPLRKRSLSAYVWTMVGVPRGVDLAPHTVVFGGDYHQEFDDLFRHRRVPRDPTIYVHAQDRGRGRPAPVPERLMMLMNAPATADARDPDPEEMAECTTRLRRRLRASGLEIEAAPERTTLTTPAEFARMFPGTGGALYGAAPHGMMATFRRPMTRTRMAGLYLAGGGAHPGPGVAMSCLSGQLAAAAIAEDHGST